MSSRTVLVVGAGPAGIAAAVRARAAGATVTIIDDNPAAGGQIWRGGRDTHAAAAWLARLRAGAVSIVNSAHVVSADAVARTLLVETPDGAREFRYHSLIIATGAREVFLPFPGWTLPGVTGAGGLQALVKSGLPIAGKRVVVAGSGPLLLAAAAYVLHRGARVRLVAEQAPWGRLLPFLARLTLWPGKLLQSVDLRLRLGTVPYRPDSWVEAAEGQSSLQRVRIHISGSDRAQVEECDYAAVSYGLAPNTELAALLGCNTSPSGIAVDEFQRISLPGVFAAGECTGIGGVELSLVEGQIAGYAATGQLDRARRLFPARRRALAFAAALNSAFALRPELRYLPDPDTIVCRCEDVPFYRLQPCASFRAAKLDTRCGMGPCQARVCGSAAHFLFGWRNESVRPPLFPTSIAALAAQPSELTTEAQVTND